VKLLFWAGRVNRGALPLPRRSGTSREELE